MEYVQGTDGNEPRLSTPMGAPPAPAPPEAAPWRRRGRTGLTVRGLPLAETSLRPHYGATIWTRAKSPGRSRTAKRRTTSATIPALKGLNIPRTGQPGIIGVLTTKIAGDRRRALFTTTASGARGAMLRAYDKATGKEVGAVYMPAPQSGSPMTYMLNGQQYIVVAISGQSFPGELVAFRLPAVSYSKRE